MGGVTAPRTGRCPTCGGTPPLWTPDAIIRAAREWAARHGRAPRVSDWERAGRGHPSKFTVVAMFGSWRSMLRAAGLTPAGYHHWTRDECVQALYEWRVKHGRLPTSDDWRRAKHGVHPAEKTIRKLYGSWREFILKYYPTEYKAQLREQRYGGSEKP